MSYPPISITVPFYKVETSPRQCLNSIVSQSYTNLEIFLIENDSPNVYPQICDEYASKDKSINKNPSSFQINQETALYKICFFTLSLLPSKMLEQAIFFHLTDRI